MEVLSRYIDGLEVLYQTTSFDMKQVGWWLNLLFICSNFFAKANFNYYYISQECSNEKKNHFRIFFQDVHIFNIFKSLKII